MSCNQHEYKATSLLMRETKSSSQLIQTHTREKVKQKHLQLVRKIKSK